MKRFYSFFLIVLASVLGFSANAGVLTLNIDDAARVTVQVDGAVQQIVTGSNVLDLDKYATVYVIATEGNVLLSVKNDAGTPQSVYNGRCYISAYNDGTYNVQSANLAEIRTDTFTLTVNGDASKVEARFEGTSQYVDVNEGRNTVAYSAEYESVLALESADYKPLYRVTLDGTPVDGDRYFTVNLTPGCEVVVETEFPEIPVKVTFEYSEGAEGCVSYVCVNDEDVEFDGKVLDCMLGDDVYVEFSPDYKVDGFSVNGEAQDMNYFYGAYNFIAGEDVVLAIDAHPYGNLNYIINIDNPEAVNVYRSYSYYGDVIELHAGENKLEISENDPMITFEKNAGYSIVKISDAEGNEYQNGNQIDITEGMVLTFETAEIVLDKQVSVYVDNKGAAQYFFGFYNSAREEIPLANGYNIVKFDSSYNPFMASWGPSAVSFVYVDGTRVMPTYEGSNSYGTIALTDGGVLKMYLAAEPVECMVNFSMGEGCEAEAVRDLIVPVALDAAAMVNCFNGTQFDITGADLAVKVNGEVIEESEGKFTFTVNTDTDVQILAAATQGIGDITADDNNDGCAVYNLQGVRVGTRADLRSLPAGLYITAGEKVLVK